MREVLVLLVMGVVGGEGIRSSASREVSLRCVEFFAFVGHARRLLNRHCFASFETV